MISRILTVTFALLLGACAVQAGTGDESEGTEKATASDPATKVQTADEVANVHERATERLMTEPSTAKGNATVSERSMVGSRCDPTPLPWMPSGCGGGGGANVAPSAGVVSQENQHVNPEAPNYER